MEKNSTLLKDKNMWKHADTSLLVYGIICNHGSVSESRQMIRSFVQPDYVNRRIDVAIAISVLNAR
ncbi:hypothetical protein M514_04433 [Trichuris suis]|uniref:Uncharacterized protein n=1 Tax=Trichuris suis TaxID=68888 RepID=A0A085MBY7_9BILA|nr:hypothetical protein M513_04433 [Trichuris suis]KFD62487.1 hypothetical protein M514_04433 [Trichuris suis]